MSALISEITDFILSLRLELFSPEEFLLGPLLILLAALKSNDCASTISNEGDWLETSFESAVNWYFAILKFSSYLISSWFVSGM